MLHRTHLLSARRSRIMENLKRTVIRLANSYPNKPLTPSQIARMEQQLLEAFPVVHTPTHPTYASMIQRAIEELDEVDGSSEKSISEYVAANYDDLPWAHKRYLSHHLNKLCEKGEIVCTSSECYTMPVLKPGQNSRKKQLKPKSGRKRKEDVIDEGNLVGKDVIEVNENQICFQEEGIRAFGDGRVKRSRPRLVISDKDDEIEGTTIVEEMENMVTSSNLVLVEGKNKIELVGADGVAGKASYLPEQQHHIGSVDKDHDLVKVGQGLPEEPQVAGFGLKTEQQLPLVSSTVVEISYVERDAEVKSGTLQMEDDGSVANLMLVPVESMEKSVLKERDRGFNSADLLLAPVVSDLSHTSMLNAKGDAPESTVKSSSSMEREHNLCVGELMIVPFDGYTHLSTGRTGMDPTSEIMHRTIICGLACPKLVQPKRNQRLKAEKMKVLLEKSMPAFPALAMDAELLEQEQLFEVSEQRGLETKLYSMLLGSSEFKEVSLVQSQQAYTSSVLYDGFNEQLKRLKCLDPSHASDPEKLVPMEDEENVPLQQVLKKCGMRRKLAIQVVAQNTPLASRESSNPVSKLQAEQPNPANSMKSMPIIKEELIWTKRKERQLQQQQLWRQHRQHGQKHCKFEAGTSATRSKALRSSVLELGKNNKRHVEQEPQISDSAADSMIETVYMEHQHQQPELRQDQESSPCVELTAEGLPSYDEQFDLEDNRHTGGDHGPPPKPEQSTKVIIKESSPTQHLKEQKKNQKHQNEQCQSVKKQRKKPKRQGRGRPPKVKPTHDSLSKDPSASLCHDGLAGQQGKSQCKVSYHDPEPAATTYGEQMIPALDQNSQQLIKQPKQLGQGRPLKQNEMVEKTVTSSLLSHSLQQIKHLKKDNQVRPRKQIEATKEDIAVSPILFIQLQEESSTPETDQHPQQQIKQLKKDGRGRPRKQSGAIKEDAAASSNLHLQQQGSSGPATHQDFQSQIKRLKKDGRGRPRKLVQETKEDAFASSNLQLQQQAGSSAPATHQQMTRPKKDGCGRSWKDKERTKEDAAASTNLLLEVQDGLSEPMTTQQPQQRNKQLKKDGQGRPRKLHDETKGDSTASMNLYLQEEEGLSEPATHQHSQQQNKQLKKDGRGRPRKQETTKEALSAPLNLGDPLEEEPSKPETYQHSQHQNKQPKRDGRGRPRKQTGENMEDEASPMNLTKEQGPSEQATQQHSLQQNKRLKIDEGKGSSAKGANKYGAASLSLHYLEQEARSEPVTHSVLDASTMLWQIDEKESQQQVNDDQIRCPDLELSAMITSEGPGCLADQPNQEHKEQKQQRQRGTRKLEAATIFSDSQTCNQHKLKLRNWRQPPNQTPNQVPSNNESHWQEKDLKQHHCIDTGNECSQNKIHWMPSEQEQSISPSNDETHQQLKKQKLHEIDWPLEAKQETTPSDNHPHQEQAEQHCHHGHEEKQGEFKGHARPPKEKSAKMKAIQVPLSSKDQLRSRMKRQSQDST